MAKEENTTTALEIFQQKQVAPALQSRILEMDPKFADRPRDEQEEVIVFLLEQAQKTVEGVKSRFPLVKVRHAGSRAIEMPRRTGEEEGAIVREFEGIILDQYNTKAFWHKRFGKDSTGAPDCASLDSVTPYTKEPISESCLTCTFNKFGSGLDNDGNPTRGKRCRDQKRVIVKLDGHDLPCRLMISPSNIGDFDTYMSDLRDQGTPIGTVRTKVKAIEAKSASGVEYTGLDFSTVRALSMDEVLALKRNVITPFGDDFRVGAIESNESGGESAGPSKDELAKGTGQKAAGVM